MWWKCSVQKIRMFCGHQCLLTFSPETAKKFSENAKKSQKSAWNVQSNTELRSPCCKNCKDVKRCDIHATLRRRVVDEIRWENWEIVITAITQIMARDTRNYHKTREIDVFFTIFLVKSKLSTAKKSKTTTFSFFQQKKKINKVGLIDKKWIFEQCV